jgi:hypothetical protein
MRFLVLSLLFVAIAAPARAGITGAITGTWEGSVSCKSEDANGKGSFSVDVTLLVTQLGASGPLVVNAIADGTQFFSGTLIPSVEKPGEGAGALIACGTSDSTTNGLYNDIETFHYKVDDNGAGSIKTSGANTTNGSDVNVCKGSFKRTSTMSPKTVSCEAL